MSIFTEQEEGARGVTSSVAGVRAILAPVTIGVVTTMTAFAPLAFSTGTLGQILRDIPVVVISVLAVSLFEARRVPRTVVGEQVSGRSLEVETLGGGIV